MIHQIDLGDVLVSSRGLPLIADEYFILGDMKSLQQTIHVFDKKTFKHLASTGQFGPGPNEITSLGHLIWNPDEREIYAIDHGKALIYAYNIDSVLSNSNYNPSIKMEMDLSAFPSDIEYFSDTMSFCRVIVPTSVSSFIDCSGTINLLTGEIKKFKYRHPDVNEERKSIHVAVSKPDKIFAECHWNSDLISIFDFEGNPIVNIFGNNGTNNSLTNYTRCIFTKNYLIATYNGKEYKNFEPTLSCILFSKRGEYLATLEVGYDIVELCYDESNDRLIFWFDDEIQICYLDLKDIKLK